MTTPWSETTQEHPTTVWLRRCTSCGAHDRRQWFARPVEARTGASSWHCHECANAHFDLVEQDWVTAFGESRPPS